MSTVINEMQEFLTEVTSLNKKATKLGLTVVVKKEGSVKSPAPKKRTPKKTAAPAKKKTATKRKPATKKTTTTKKPATKKTTKKATTKSKDALAF